MKTLAKRTPILVAALTIATTAWFAAGVLWPLERPSPATAGPSLLIRDVRLLDLDEGELRANTDILVRDGVIVAVGEDLEASGAVEYGAAGRVAIPGLFDMHVHNLRLAPLLTHPLFVAAGVTAVRDMGGCLGDFDAWVACAADKREWQRDVAAGQIVGPRFDQVTSLAIDGGREIPAGWDPALGAATAAGALARVAHDADRGIDFLKPYTLLPREGYFGLADAARSRGLYLAGHKPLRVSALEAIDAGQRSIEHAFLFIWECYPGIEALRRVENVREAYTNATRETMIAQHDEARCESLYDAMTEGTVAFVPTHTTRKLDAFAADPAFRDDPRLRYIPAPLRALWLEDADGMAERSSVSGSYRRFYELGLRQTGRAHRAGVTVLAGTDAPDSFAFPGLALHDELEHLVQAGLSPLDALRAATVEPARFLGLEGRAGVIRPGARADVVLLRENPLDDINAVREIDTVILAGNAYDRDRLDALLAQVETNAGHWSLWPKFIWQALRSPIFRAQFKD